jgi:hypothetical protein
MPLRYYDERLSAGASRLLFAQPRVWVIELLITLCSLRLLSADFFSRRPLKRSFAAARCYMETEAWVSGEPYHRFHHHYSIVCTCTPPCWMRALSLRSSHSLSGRCAIKWLRAGRMATRNETRPRPLCFNEVVKEGAEKGARP